jgi:hypothetical protein
MLTERLGLSFVYSYLLIHNVLSSQGDIPTVYFLNDGHVSIALNISYRTKMYTLTKTLTT